jgi:hypothetical protein
MSEVASIISLVETQSLQSNVSPKEAPMATAKTAPFEELTKLASDFVTAQKGT